MTDPLPIMSAQELKDASSVEDGFGSLKTDKGPLPLKAMDVQARIDGLVAEVDLRQTFVNNLGEPLEATYIFPLPDRAAVTSFRMEVAGRVVEGVLKERGEARKEYDDAIRSGHRAAIAEEERSGVFTLRVGNLKPDEEAVVHMKLTGPIPFTATTFGDGEATFRFPLVVAPRYIPGIPLSVEQVGDGTAFDTDQAPDASRITPPVLLPGYPHPVRLSLSVDLQHRGLPVNDIRSSLHAVISEDGAGGQRIRLSPGERLDRDFILRFRVGDGVVRSSLLVQPDKDNASEGTFLLTVVPPKAHSTLLRPRDIVFVLDRSGSMRGWKIMSARQAVARMVETLQDQDRFNVYAFDDRIETPPRFEGENLLAGSDSNRFQAAEFLAEVQARGGTEMAEPLDRAVKALGSSEGGRDRILVLVTDGQVGNEDHILRSLAPHLGQVRVFALGIDRAVNAGFLSRLATLGGGACELVESEKRLEEVMDKVHRLISVPVLTGIRLNSMGLDIKSDSVVPERFPDLFSGVPLFFQGRCTGDLRGAVMLEGRDREGRPWTERVEAVTASGEAVAPLWARGRIRALEDKYVVGSANRRKLEKEIVSISLRFSVLCRFTAYVAVDRSESVNKGGRVLGVVQPVELPEGWEMPRAGVLSDMLLSDRAECGLHSPLSEDFPARQVFKSLGSAAGYPWRKDKKAGEEEEIPLKLGDLPACRTFALELAEFIERALKQNAATPDILSYTVRVLKSLFKHLESLGAPSSEIEPLEKLLSQLPGGRMVERDWLLECAKALRAFAGESAPSSDRKLKFWK